MVTRLLLWSLLAGCAGSDTELAAAAPAATPGWYELDNASGTDWACAGGAPHADEAARTSSLAELTLTADGSGLTWRWADASDPLPCQLDGLTFTCEVYTSTRREGESPEECTEVKDERWLEGEWTAAGLIEGANVRALSCDGEDCDDAARAYGDDFAFPCEGSRAFAATLVDG